MIYIFNKKSDVTYDQVCWPILGIYVLRLTQSAHTRNTAGAVHTVNTQLEQWEAIYAAEPGEQLGVRYLAQGHLSHVIEGGEDAVHSLASPRLELTTFRLRVWLSNY